MNKKILVFVCKREKFLLLRNNSQDPSHGGDYWFTVTGSVEKNEGKEEAIKREVLFEKEMIDDLRKRVA
jgi:NADH pyrophosphatase NudC (nudix superfamily)